MLLTYAIAALGIGAALMHVSPAYALLLGGFVCLGAYWDLRDSHPLSTWMLNFLTIIGILTTLALPNGNGVIGRLLSAAVVLLGGKLLAAKKTRDQLQIMLLSLLLLVGAAILSLNLSFSLLFGLYLLLSTLALIWLPFGSALGEARVARGFVKRVSLVAGGLALASIPLLAMFFLALPRASMPLWQGVAPLSSQSTGFTDEVRLGDISRIIKSDQVAFRAEVRSGQRPLPYVPYWRGLLFEETDGITWKKATEPTNNTGLAWLPTRAYPARPDGPPPTSTAAGVPVDDPGGPASSADLPLVEPVSQVVYLEPHGMTNLFGLDRPVQASSGMTMGIAVWDGVMQIGRPVMQRFRYEVVSQPSAWLPQPLEAQARARCLTLPADLPPVVAQKAGEATRYQTDPYIKAQLLLQHFHSGEYAYSLSGPGETGHPLEAFLSQTKTGFCEHFASAMTLMLRSVGVPARMVGGYLGGDYNASGAYYLVRQRSAHAWVEAYIDGLGWLRLDPTPPGQASSGVNSSGELNGPSGLIDSLRLKWYSLVIGYDLNRQFALMRSLSDDIGRGLSFRPSLTGLTAYLPLLLAAVAALTGFFLWRSHSGRDPMEALYATLLRRLRRRGVERGPAEGPSAFAARAAAARPAGTAVIHAITDRYVRRRYREQQPEPSDLRALRRSLRRVRL